MQVVIYYGLALSISSSIFLCSSNWAALSASNKSFFLFIASATHMLERSSYSALEGVLTDIDRSLPVMFTALTLTPA